MSVVALQNNKNNFENVIFLVQITFKTQNIIDTNKEPHLKNVLPRNEKDKIYINKGIFYKTGTILKMFKVMI